MIAGDKTIINTAGEIWLKGVMQGAMDSSRLGRVIGLHQSIEFAPLKRFTDLVSQQLYRVSTLHNQALQVLFENILKELRDEPVKNLKKLLEIYIVIVAGNSATVSDPEVISKLKVWSDVGGLQKLLKGLV